MFAAVKEVKEVGNHKTRASKQGKQKVQERHRGQGPGKAGAEPKVIQRCLPVKKQMHHQYWGEILNQNKEGNVEIQQSWSKWKGPKNGRSTISQCGVLGMQSAKKLVGQCCDNGSGCTHKKQKYAMRSMDIKAKKEE
jgi:hypothetical protein